MMKNQVKKNNIENNQQSIFSFKNYYEYAQGALRTLNKIDERFDVGHMGLGLATEFLELRKAIKKDDHVNIIEEIGDANWYISNFLLFYFKESSQVWNDLTMIYFKPQSSILSIDEEMEYIEDKIEKFCDNCKKRFAYDKKINDYENVFNKLSIDIHKSLVSILLKINSNPVECLGKNISKLYKRYPDKFDSYLAMNRDLAQEYDVLKLNVNNIIKK